MNSLLLKSILFVDDDEISNLFNKIFIKKLNLEVEVNFALNGKEVIDMLKSAEGDPTILIPCLIFLDIKMPIMNGWQFLEAYETDVSQEIRDKIAIVMLTTSEDEGDKVKAMKNPTVKAYLQKPLAEESILDLIGKYFTKPVQG